MKSPPRRLAGVRLGFCECRVARAAKRDRARAAFGKGWTDRRVRRSFARLQTG
jgi:hypothetical protein